MLYETVSTKQDPNKVKLVHGNYYGFVCETMKRKAKIVVRGKRPTREGSGWLAKKTPRRRLAHLMALGGASEGKGAQKETMVSGRRRRGNQSVAKSRAREVHGVVALGDFA
ncbi:hypothetical protein HAX54_030590 [Datura stramonium]|uniref:Uncharacterized protein n=1 Tax=Datura stramonium TaxID=4076 RepID=A0ABS8VAP9_DATST|nr:hypothetical protein [Datura stramonium]